MGRIREYIISNALKWEFDRENPVVGAGLKPAQCEGQSLKTKSSSTAPRKETKKSASCIMMKTFG
jgi:hypothetical protein